LLSQSEATSQKTAQNKISLMVGMHSACSNYPKSVVYLTAIYPPAYLALPVNSPYLKNGGVEIILHVAVVFSTFKCPKISHFFDKSVSQRHYKQLTTSSAGSYFSPRADVISSHRHCSGILCWNCPHVQVVSAKASSKQVALALTTCTRGQFQASK
jgi:hypothetical protein